MILALVKKDITPKLMQTASARNSAPIAVRPTTIYTLFFTINLAFCQTLSVIFAQEVLLKLLNDWLFF